MKIIGLGGEKESGKSTVSSFFVKYEKFQEVAFADPLKQMLIKVTGLDSKFFYDQNLKEKELDSFIFIDHDFLDKIYSVIENDWQILLTQEMKENIDCFSGTTIKTPRVLMQTIGTDMLRSYVRNDIWIVLFFAKLKEISGNVIVSDVRLLNEREALKKAGAKLVRIKRPGLKQDNHISETDLGKDDEYDAVINNNDITLGQLRSEVLMWYSVAGKYK